MIKAVAILALLCVVSYIQAEKCKDVISSQTCKMRKELCHKNQEFTKHCKKTCKACHCHRLDGNWGAWTSYGSCSKTCGSGSQKRTRKCDNPAPKRGGNQCVGPAEQSQPCQTQNCPVNGKYGSWSAYSACSKSCDSGVKKRTRICNNPAPAYGGSPCSGSASETEKCNIQPCLKPTHCEYKYTNFDDDGNGGTVYLDRHSLHCSTGYVLNALRLERNNGHNKIRYAYRCCRSQLSCTDWPKINTQTYNGGGEGNSVYLDRQTISCGNGGISYLKLNRKYNNWNYRYNCCYVSRVKGNISCQDRNSGFNDDGRGNAHYLDRHRMQCASDKEFITYLKLIRNSGHNKIRYNYKCCKYQ